MKLKILPLMLVSTLLTIPSFAQKSNDQLSKELSNPVAKLINMPLQQNWDYGGGPRDRGQHYYLQVQPVIPLTLNADWNIISRSVLLFENEHNFGTDSTTGLGDLTQTFFFTPNKKKEGGLMWGLGPVFLLPTASDDDLGSHKYGAGPSGVLVGETEKFTYGILASHTWSFAGDEEYNDVNKTFLQPFVAYHLPKAYTITATTEYTYDWDSNEEVFPVNLMLAKVVKIGKMPISFSAGGRYYLDTPSGGPNWGLRGMITFVFPE